MISLLGIETPPERSDFAPGEGEIPAPAVGEGEGDALGDGDSSGDGLGEGVGDVLRFFRGEDDGEGDAFGEGDSSGDLLGDGVDDAFRLSRGEEDGEGDADGDGDFFGIGEAEAVDFGEALGLGETLGLGLGEGEGVGDDFFFEEADRFFGAGVGVGSSRRFSFVPNDGSARDSNASGPAMSANPHSIVTPMLQSRPLFNAPVPAGLLCLT